ncbi:hypothetical protein AX762_08885 [Alkalibacterium sp. 20]|nr:hypothetical protein AX762_08885 [Alkalibacterium sp. 20]
MILKNRKWENASRSTIFGLSHLGFNIPPKVDVYWVGEAVPGPFYIEAEGTKSDFIMNSAKKLGYNLVDNSEMLKKIL